MCCENFVKSQHLLEFYTLWCENRGKWKGWQPPTVEPRTPLAWVASALPLSYSNQTTTNSHNPLYVLQRTMYYVVFLLSQVTYYFAPQTPMDTCKYICIIWWVWRQYSWILYMCALYFREQQVSENTAKECNIHPYSLLTHQIINLLYTTLI